MNFFKIAYRDISSIFKDRFIRVSVTAIVIVPLLYSLLYLDAFWDPYSKLSQMSVAVVNLDKGGVNDGKAVNYGKDLADKLNVDKRVGFKIVSEKAAESGLKDKKGYYAMFLIPSNFSEAILKAKTGKPEIAKIFYTSNDKKNFLASQINGKVIVQLKAELTKNIVDQDTKVAFDGLYEARDGMNKAAVGSKKLYDGLLAAKDGSKQLSQGLTQLNTNVPEMKAGVKTLTNGSGTLVTGLNTAKLVVGELYDGATKLNAGLGELAKQGPILSDGVGKLYAGTLTLSGGLKSENDGLLNKVLPSTQSLTDGLDKLSQGLLGASSGATQLSTAASALNSAAGTVDTKGTLLNAAGALSSAAAKIKGGTDTLKPVIGQLVTGSNGVKVASAQVANGVDNLINQVQTNQATLKSTVAKDLGAYIAANPSALGDTNMQKFIATLNTLNTQAIDPSNTLAITSLQTGTHQLASGSSDLANGINVLNSGVGVFVDGAMQFSAGASQYSLGADKFAKGASQYVAGAITLGSGLKDAISGSKQLSDGANSLNNALKGDFATGLVALSQGADKVKSGVQDLNSNIPVLKDGITTLYNGSKQLKDGLGNTNDRSKLPLIINVITPGTLIGGMDQLYNGSTQLKGGLSLLNNKIPALANGTSKLYNGALDLNSGLGKLKSGAKELSGTMSRKSTS